MALRKVYIVLSVLVAALLVGCASTTQQAETECDGIFAAKLSGDVQQQLCIPAATAYQLNDNGLQFKVKSHDIAGNSLFELKLENFTGPGDYHFGIDQQARFSLNVYGASDEFYRCVSGKIVVSEATASRLQAEFEVTFEGFYNKRTIHARGGIHL